MTTWLGSQPTTADRLGWSSTLVGMTPRSRSTSTDKPADDQSDQPAETEDVEVKGTGPEGEWRPETHGESPTDRPKSEF